ncbi:substrate-binding periplasmic protein [Lacimicrobium alkaliphilum]|uniref:Solute-binding protein family 3/N-terminal domain-containing protein n=1 Tax=Lacimicrobium alkaliphilum TaxID=1526571 RepID=A0ABQ1RBD1_9ALTE|nr:transporter substrate-binding domain-containing protein [Lacimicrobium alkaliphilum]GGD64011.1 hypothetical protein GCM10011357_19230 [Lacimicrobium alkaliphilum]
MRLFVIIIALIVLNAANVQAETVRVGLHYSAPWAYANDEGELRGIDYDIVRHIFNELGFEVDIELFAYERLVQKFRDKELDYISPMAFELPGAHLTEDYLEIQDVAVTSVKTAIKLEKIEDLEGKAVVAYQKATEVLGQEFAAAVAKGAYMEMADRERQLDLLKHLKVDVVVGDRSVLEYFSTKNYGEGSIEVHEIFPHTNYPGVFWDAELAKAFNEILIKMRKTGLLKKYHSKTRS